MDKLYTFKDTIYESPDNGKTVYARRHGETKQTLVAQNLTIRVDPMDQLHYNISYSDFIDIMKLSETNITLRDCVENLRSTYYLIKNNEQT